MAQRNLDEMTKEELVELVRHLKQFYEDIDEDDDDAMSDADFHMRQQLKQVR